MLLIQVLVQLNQNSFVDDSITADHSKEILDQLTFSQILDKNYFPNPQTNHLLDPIIENHFPGETTIRGIVNQNFFYVPFELSIMSSLAFN
jgi:hypothetical protein